MPLLTVHVIDRDTREPIRDNGVYVSIQQDKLLEGFKEQARTTPSPVDGTVKFEASSVTKYRIVADGSWYDSNEVLVDIGLNFIMPVNVDLPLKRQHLPTPDLDIAHYARDIGLAQLMPVVLIFIAIAAAIAGVAYLASKASHIIPKKKEVKA